MLSERGLIVIEQVEGGATFRG